MLADIFVGVVWLLIFLFAVSQFLVPLASGRSMLPSFSGKERKLNDLKKQLKKLRERNEELELQQQIDREQKRNLEIQLAAFSDTVFFTNEQNGTIGSREAQKGSEETQ